MTAGRAVGAVLAALALAGCAPAAPLDTAQLAAAVERFERAAAQAEAAAAEAEASARQAARAAEAVAAKSGAAAAAPAARDGEVYRRCATAGRGPVASPAQAAGIGRRFAGCLDLDWGEPTAAVLVRRERREWDVYRVEFGARGAARAVLIGVADGRADLPPP